MKSDRGIRITIETERIVLLLRKQSNHGRCERCGYEADPVQPYDISKAAIAVPGWRPRPVPGGLRLKQMKQRLAVYLKPLALFVKAVRRH